MADARIRVVTALGVCHLLDARWNHVRVLQVHAPNLGQQQLVRIGERMKHVSELGSNPLDEISITTERIAAV